ncbi:hypothetical protein L1987_03869 [Smallanthus sonchifolius]|uniref:Uncharacterized protein n=1 Tax=Smallanthus sonchifolius TaxID=185202 RepID=A0ACB9KBR2_9ASTR|nr:hypothetical protein L1987_03869 [Smallanthus sonchifolius]
MVALLVLIIFLNFGQNGACRLLDGEFEETWMKRGNLFLSSLQHPSEPSPGSGCGNTGNGGRPCVGSRKVAGRHEFFYFKVLVLFDSPWRLSLSIMKKNHKLILAKENGKLKEVLDVNMEPEAENVQDKKDGEDPMIMEKTSATKEVQEGDHTDEDFGLDDYDDLEDFVLLEDNEQGSYGKLGLTA